MAKTHKNKYRIDVKFLREYPRSKFYYSDAVFLFVADFTKRTQSARSVEVFENSVPASPGSDAPMDGFTIDNPGAIEVFTGVFDDNEVVNEDGPIKHSEGVFFPTTRQDGCWISFLEIKDCAPRNMTDYNAEIKEKMKNCKDLFVSKRISSRGNTFWGIASFPRVKLQFDDSIFNDLFIQKEMVDSVGVHFFAANHVLLREGKIEPVYD